MALVPIFLTSSRSLTSVMTGIQIVGLLLSLQSNDTFSKKVNP